ncbi:hypothetical protein [Rhizobium sp. RU35A]|uniref:hypothetical protein n=1 Tax=Rhizobium sp. RU35A TaxID=1907414 RepID=UPI00165F3D20|nr:hypothetical protein [Rhizobium sp. RU35A]
MAKISVAIIDDDKSLRNTLVSLLQACEYGEMDFASKCPEPDAGQKLVSKNADDLCDRL